MEGYNHPRGCGENMLQQLKSNPAAQSPPRMRGKHLTGKGRQCLPAISPGDAGKPTLDSKVPRRAPEPPPRMRGKLQISGNRGYKMDHPRGCGENASCLALYGV